APGGNGFRRGLLVPDYKKQIAVGHARHIMMEELLIIEKLEVPQEMAVPSELLDPARRTWAAAEGTVCAAEIGRPEQVAVLQEVRAVNRIDLRLPGVDDPSLVVDQVRFLRVHRAEERVTREGSRLV